MEIYLKKEMSQTVCIYFLNFVTGGCEKLIFGAAGVKKYSEVGDHEKVNEV